MTTKLKINLKQRVEKAGELIKAVSALEDKNKYLDYEYYHFSKSDEKLHKKLTKQLDDLTVETIEVLYEAGYADADGLTSEQADALYDLGILKEPVSYLYQFGNGWC